EPVAFDVTTGILLLDSAEKDWLLIAIIDDPSESPLRVIRWTDSAYQQVSGMVDENQVIIVTADQGRAEEMLAISRFRIVEVKTVAQSVSQEVSHKGHTKNRRPRRRRHPQGHRR